MAIYLYPSIQGIAIATVFLIPKGTGGVVMTHRHQDSWWLVGRGFQSSNPINVLKNEI